MFFCNKKKASNYTIISYRHNLKVFVDQTTKNQALLLNEVQYKHIISFKTYLKKQGYSQHTQFSYLSAVRSFLKWCNQCSFPSLNYTLVTLPKIESNKKAFIEGVKIDQALLSINVDQYSGRRDKAIMELLVATGIRVSELVSLDRDDIDYENRKVTVSGKKDRVVSLSTRSLQCLSDYLCARGDKASALFVSLKGKKRHDTRMTVRSVQRLVKKYAFITPTILRRSFTVDLLVAGESMNNLRRVLGQKHLY